MQLKTVDKRVGIEAIYSRAEKMKLPIYSYIKSRIDNSNPEHIIPNVDELDDEDFKDYWEALYNVQNEHAMSYDGWVSAHDTFKRIGFVKQEVRQGHRIFVSYSFKPKAT